MPGLADYANWPGLCGMLMSNDKATLKELSSYYSVYDTFLMAEIIQVDAYNDRRATEHFKETKG